MINIAMIVILRILKRRNKKILKQIIYKKLWINNILKYVNHANKNTLSKILKLIIKINIIIYVVIALIIYCVINVQTI